jgi:hypothetical protein
MTQFLETFIDQEGLSKATLSAATRVIRAGFEFANPLYVGLAVGQSFSARLAQHLSGESGFASLAREAGLQWSDLAFRCIPLETATAASVASLEKLLQALFKPTFCRG